MSDKTHFSLIRDNFREIYSIQKHEGPSEKAIVASLWNSRLYNSNSGFGKFWKVVYLILGNKIAEKRLSMALSKTQFVFNEQLKGIQTIVDQYHTYINQKSNGGEIDEKKYLSCRWHLTSWYNATNPFLSLVHQQKLSSQTQTFFQEHLTLSKDNHPPFACEALFKRVSHLQRILDLEGLYQGPLPYAIFQKLATGKELTRAEKSEITKWIQFINKQGDKITIHFFHRFLKSLVDEFQEAGSSLARLEMGLVDRECKLFLQRDLEHLQWRNQLKPGDTIECNGKTLILGERIGVKQEGFDQTVHFSIQDDPKKIVSIGVNESILGLKKILSEEQGFAVKMAEYVEVDATGKCALVEKLSDSLDQFPWTSQKDLVSDEDEDLLAPLAGLIRWFVKEKLSPHHLSPHHLMFDPNGVLKSLKLVLKTTAEDFDFNYLEEFIRKCSAGNSRIFQHLMEASGLREHPYAKFYELVVKNALQASPTSIQQIANSREITDPRIVKRAEELYKEVKELELECLQRIQQDYQVPHKKIIKQVSGQIFSHYQMSSGASLIWPLLKQEVIQTVIKTQNLEGSKISSLEAPKQPNLDSSFKNLPNVSSKECNLKLTNENLGKK